MAFLNLDANAGTGTLWSLIGAGLAAKSRYRSVFPKRCPLAHLPPCLDLIGPRDSSGRGQVAASCCKTCIAPGMRCAARMYRKGRHPFYQGDEQVYVYRVQSGGLNLFLNLGNGRRQIVGFAFPGDFVGLGLHHEFLFTAEAFVRTELRCIPKDELHFLALKDARIAFKLYEATA